MQEEELQRYVRRKLRHTLFEPVWSILQREQYVEDVLVGAKTPGWLVEEARAILKTRTPVEKPAEPANERGPNLGQERIWALSQLVAHHAATDRDVVAFRAKYLPDGLLPRGDVEKWINKRVKEDGERTSDVTFTIPPGTQIEWDGPTLRFSPPIAEVRDEVSFSGRMIAYSLPGDTGLRRRAVTARGVLDQLRRLGDSLADAFGWQPAQATVFVLTGVTPLIATAKEDVTVVKVRHEVDLSWARRNKLDIDPSASPREVLEAFERARREYHRANRRSMSLKHLRLAAFAGAEHADKPWAARHQLWNERFPEWAYSEQSNFRRDAAQAHNRLLR